MLHRIHFVSGFGANEDILNSAVSDFGVRIQEDHPRDAVWFRPYRHWKLLGLVPVTIVQQPTLLKSHTGYLIWYAVVDVPAGMEVMIQ
jgi:hypothetical protein